eukprot:TRINITY_DN17057_c0_g2_i1.p1 TRINITY_DN17057_c0_g2~~TRINITY_DN17057_c0_g2_i1.p1  ORF type:complete len:5392 (+),score=1134.91 TRINITY_DN17057_c0_g2_i1:2341-16176(+)
MPKGSWPHVLLSQIVTGGVQQLQEVLLANTLPDEKDGLELTYGEGASDLSHVPLLNAERTMRSLFLNASLWFFSNCAAVRGVVGGATAAEAAAGRVCAMSAIELCGVRLSSIRWDDQGPRSQPIVVMRSYTLRGEWSAGALERFPASSGAMSTTSVGGGIVGGFTVTLEGSTVRLRGSSKWFDDQTEWSRDDFGGACPVSVAAGWRHFVVILQDGRAAFCGKPDSIGKLKPEARDIRGSKADVFSRERQPAEKLVEIVSPEEGDAFRSAACGLTFTMLTTTNGCLWNAPHGREHILELIYGSDVVSVAAGLVHCVILMHDGTVATRCCGMDEQGMSPKKDLLAVCVAAGETHSAVVLVDGSVLMWGNNSSGQADNDAMAASLRGRKAVAVSCGYDFTLALTDTNEIVACGSNNFGQLDGWGNLRMGRSTAMREGAVELAKGFCSLHCSVRMKDGRLVSWGKNDLGQCAASGAAPRPSVTLPSTDPEAARKWAGSPVASRSRGKRRDEAGGTGLLHVAVAIGAIVTSVVYVVSENVRGSWANRHIFRRGRGGKALGFHGSGRRAAAFPDISTWRGRRVGISPVLLSGAAPCAGVLECAGMQTEYQASNNWCASIQEWRGAAREGGKWCSLEGLPSEDEQRRRDALRESQRQARNQLQRQADPEADEKMCRAELRFFVGRRRYELDEDWEDAELTRWNRKQRIDKAAQRGTYTSCRDRARAPEFQLVWLAAQAQAESDLRDLADAEWKPQYFGTGAGLLFSVPGKVSEPQKTYTLGDLELMAVPNGATTLHVVAETLQTDLCLELEKRHGANVNATDWRGQSALHTACSKADGAETVSALVLEVGVSGCLRDNLGQTAMLVAAKKRNWDVVSALLDAAGKKEDAHYCISSSSSDAFTVMHFAAAAGELNLCRRLKAAIPEDESRGVMEGAQRVAEPVPVLPPVTWTADNAPRRGHRWEWYKVREKQFGALDVWQKKRSMRRRTTRSPLACAAWAGKWGFVKQAADEKLLLLAHGEPIHVVERALTCPHRIGEDVSAARSVAEMAVAETDACERWALVNSLGEAGFVTGIEWMSRHVEKGGAEAELALAAAARKHNVECMKAVLQHLGAVGSSLALGAAIETAPVPDAVLDTLLATADARSHIDTKYEGCAATALCIAVSTSQTRAVSKLLEAGAGLGQAGESVLAACFVHAPRHPEQRVAITSALMQDAEEEEWTQRREFVAGLPRPATPRWKIGQRAADVEETAKLLLSKNLGWDGPEDAAFALMQACRLGYIRIVRLMVDMLLEDGTLSDVLSARMPVACLEHWLAGAGEVELLLDCLDHRAALPDPAGARVANWAACCHQPETLAVVLSHKAGVMPWEQLLPWLALEGPQAHNAYRDCRFSKGSMRVGRTHWKTRLRTSWVLRCLDSVAKVDNDAMVVLMSNKASWPPIAPYLDDESVRERALRMIKCCREEIKVWPRLLRQLAAQGNADSLKWLVQVLPPTETTGDGVDHALFDAASNWRPDCIHALVKGLEGVCIRPLGEDGLSALVAAVAMRAGREDCGVLETMIRVAGDGVNTAGRYHCRASLMTPLAVAAATLQDDAVGMLLQAGAIARPDAVEACLSTAPPNPSAGFARNFMRSFPAEWQRPEALEAWQETQRLPFRHPCLEGKHRFRFPRKSHYYRNQPGAPPLNRFEFVRKVTKERYGQEVTCVVTYRLEDCKQSKPNIGAHVRLGRKHGNHVRAVYLDSTRASRATDAANYRMKLNSRLPPPLRATKTRHQVMGRAEVARKILGRLLDYGADFGGESNAPRVAALHLAAVKGYRETATRVVQLLGECSKLEAVLNADMMDAELQHLTLPRRKPDSPMTDGDASTRWPAVEHWLAAGGCVQALQRCLAVRKGMRWEVPTSLDGPAALFASVRADGDTAAPPATIAPLEVPLRPRRRWRERCLRNGVLMRGLLQGKGALGRYIGGRTAEQWPETGLLLLSDVTGQGVVSMLVGSEEQDDVARIQGEDLWQAQEALAGAGGAEAMRWLHAKMHADSGRATRVLMAAVRARCAASARVALEMMQATVEAVDGVTPLAAAVATASARWADVEVLRLVARAAAAAGKIDAPSSLTEFQQPNAGTTPEATPLLLAAASLQRNAVAVLLEEGAGGGEAGRGVLAACFGMAPPNPSKCVVRHTIRWNKDRRRSTSRRKSSSAKAGADDSDDEGAAITPPVRLPEPAFGRGKIGEARAATEEIAALLLVEGRERGWDGGEDAAVSLRLAASRGYTEAATRMVSALSARKELTAALEHKVSSGPGVEHWLAGEGCCDALRECLGARPTALRATWAGQQHPFSSPADWAALCAQPQALALLLAHPKGGCVSAWLIERTVAANLREHLAVNRHRRKMDKGAALVRRLVHACASGGAAEHSTALHGAAALGDARVLELLLHAGAELPGPTSVAGRIGKVGALWLAAASGDVGAAKLCSTGSHDGRSPLPAVVLLRDPDILKAVCAAAGARLDEADDLTALKVQQYSADGGLPVTGVSRRSLALQSRFAIDAPLLRGNGDDVRFVSHVTPLGAACAIGWITGVEMLLDAGAKVDQTGGRTESTRDSDGAELSSAQLCVSFAAWRRDSDHEQVLRMIVSKGGLSGMENERLAATVRVAAEKGLWKAVTAMAEKAPKHALAHPATEEALAPMGISASAGLSKSHLLCAATAACEDGVLRALLSKHCPAVSSEYADAQGRSPLHVAALKGSGRCVKVLLEHADGHAGTIADARDEKGRTPLMLAARHSDPEVTAMLIAAGASVSATVLMDSSGVRPGYSPLTAAVTGAGSVSVLEALEKAGDSTFAKWLSGAGFTDANDPVRLAGVRGHGAAVSWLLSRRKEKQPDSNSLLLIAAEGGCADLVTQALEQGGDPTHTSGEDMFNSPLSVAWALGHLGALKVLLAPSCRESAINDADAAILSMCKPRVREAGPDSEALAGRSFTPGLLTAALRLGGDGCAEGLFCPSRRHSAYDLSPYPLTASTIAAVKQAGILPGHREVAAALTACDAAMLPAVLRLAAEGGHKLQPRDRLCEVLNSLSMRAGRSTQGWRDRALAEMLYETDASELLEALEEEEPPEPFLYLCAKANAVQIAGVYVAKLQEAQREGQLMEELDKLVEDGCPETSNMEDHRIPDAPEDDAPRMSQTRALDLALLLGHVEMALFLADLGGADRAARSLYRVTDAAMLDLRCPPLRAAVAVADAVGKLTELWQWLRASEQLLREHCTDVHEGCRAAWHDALCAAAGQLDIKLPVTPEMIKEATDGLVDASGVPTALLPSCLSCMVHGRWTEQAPFDVLAADGGEKMAKVTLKADSSASVSVRDSAAVDTCTFKGGVLQLADASDTVAVLKPGLDTLVTASVTGYPKALAAVQRGRAEELWPGIRYEVKPQWGTLLKQPELPAPVRRLLTSFVDSDREVLRLPPLPQDECAAVCAWLGSKHCGRFHCIPFTRMKSSYVAEHSPFTRGDGQGPVRARNEGCEWVRGSAVDTGEVVVDGGDGQRERFDQVVSVGEREYCLGQLVRCRDSGQPWRLGVVVGCSQDGAPIIPAEYHGDFTGLVSAQSGLEERGYLVGDEVQFRADGMWRRGVVAELAWCGVLPNRPIKQSVVLHPVRLAQRRSKQGTRKLPCTLVGCGPRTWDEVEPYGTTVGGRLESRWQRGVAWGYQQKLYRTKHANPATSHKCLWVVRTCARAPGELTTRRVRFVVPTGIPMAEVAAKAMDEAGLICIGEVRVEEAGGCESADGAVVKLSVRGDDDSPPTRRPELSFEQYSHCFRFTSWRAVHLLSQSTPQQPSGRRVTVTVDGISRASWEHWGIANGDLSELLPVERHLSVMGRRGERGNAELGLLWAQCKATPDDSLEKNTSDAVQRRLKRFVESGDKSCELPRLNQLARLAVMVWLGVKHPGEFVVEAGPRTVVEHVPLKGDPSDGDWVRFADSEDEESRLGIVLHGGSKPVVPARYQLLGSAWVASDRRLRVLSEARARDLVWNRDDIQGWSEGRVISVHSGQPVVIGFDERSWNHLWKEELRWRNPAVADTGVTITRRSAMRTASRTIELELDCATEVTAEFGLRAAAAAGGMCFHDIAVCAGGTKCAPTEGIDKNDLPAELSVKTSPARLEVTPAAPDCLELLFARNLRAPSFRTHMLVLPSLRGSEKEAALVKVKVRGRYANVAHKASGRISAVVGSSAAAAARCARQFLEGRRSLDDDRHDVPMLLQSIGFIERGEDYILTPDIPSCRKHRMGAAFTWLLTRGLASECSFVPLRAPEPSDSEFARMPEGGLVEQEAEYRLWGGHTGGGRWHRSKVTVTRETNYVVTDCETQRPIHCDQFRSVSENPHDRLQEAVLHRNAGERWKMSFPVGVAEGKLLVPASTISTRLFKDIRKTGGSWRHGQGVQFTEGDDDEWRDGMVACVSSSNVVTFVGESPQTWDEYVLSAKESATGKREPSNMRACFKWHGQRQYYFTQPADCSSELLRRHMRGRRTAWLLQKHDGDDPHQPFHDREVELDVPWDDMTAGEVAELAADQLGLTCFKPTLTDESGVKIDPGTPLTACGLQQRPTLIVEGSPRPRGAEPDQVSEAEYNQNIRASATELMVTTGRVPQELWSFCC